MKHYILTYLLAILGTSGAAGRTGRLYSPDGKISDRLENTSHETHNS